MTATAEQDQLDALVAESSVIVCCGPGGVGKTTTAAVIGHQAARSGRRCVVVTIDPARRLADALGLPGGLTGEPRQIGVEALSGSGSGSGSGELWAMMLDTPAMFERVVRAHADTPAQAERIVANRFFRNIASTLSGTQEYMASEALHELHRDERFDLVVVDTPPSRNALEFLEAPGVLTRFLDHQVFRLMMMPTRTGLRALTVVTQPLLRAIGKVVGSDVLADAVAFFQAFAGMERGFRQRAAEVTELLEADTTRFVVISAPHQEVVDESLWFSDQLAERGFSVAAAIVNRVHPRFGDATVADADRRAAAERRRQRPDAAALWDNLSEQIRLADAHRAVIAPLYDRIELVVEAPRLAGDVHDAPALELLRGHLFG